MNDKDTRQLAQYLKHLDAKHETVTREDINFRIKLNSQGHIPVVLHSVKGPDGEMAISEARARAILSKMPRYFTNSQLQLILPLETEDIEFHQVSETQFFGLGPSEHVDLLKAYVTHPDYKEKLNLFFVNEMSDYVCGRATFLYQTYQGIVIATEEAIPEDKRNCVYLDDEVQGTSFELDTYIEHTLAHEIGHFFNARHTHEFLWADVSSKPVRELVTRQVWNCKNRGDELCTTPADYGLSSENVDILVQNTEPLEITCSYVGNEKDASGEWLTPDPSNVMSYAPTPCGGHFEDEQLEVIKKGLEYRLVVENEEISKSNGLTIFPNPYSFSRGIPLTMEFKTPGITSLKATFEIFDTKGLKHFSTILESDHPGSPDKVQIQWDGNLRGRPLPSGSYFVHLRVYPSHLSAVDIKTKDLHKPIVLMTQAIVFMP